KGGPGSGGQCRDRSAPVTRLTPRGLRKSRKAISLKGKAFDRGCKATATRLARKGRVESVLVSVQKVRARHGRRLLKPNGRLEPHVGPEPLEHARDLLLRGAGAQPPRDLARVVLVLVERLVGELRDPDRIPLLEQQPAQLAVAAFEPPALVLLRIHTGGVPAY